MSIILGTQTFKAMEDISATNFVYCQPSGLLDNFQTYANAAALQAVYIDSDAVNKMVSQDSSHLNMASQLSLYLGPVAGNNTNDYVDRTISSTDYTGYTVHLIAKGSALSGIWEFLLSSGANLVTNNVKKSLVFSTTSNWEHLSFTVASMTADNGTYAPSATLHAGFRCASDTGSKDVTVKQVWFQKDGTTYTGIKKTIGGKAGGTTVGSWGMVTIGAAPSAITSGNVGTVLSLGPILGGFSNLVPGYDYHLGNTAGAITYNGRATADSTYLDDPWYGESARIGVAVSETELMLIGSVVP